MMYDSYLTSNQYVSADSSSLPNTKPPQSGLFNSSTASVQYFSNSSFFPGSLTQETPYAPYRSNNSNSLQTAQAGGIRLDNMGGISDLSDAERLQFTVKLFSFFSLQKLVIAIFISVEYNGAIVRNYIGNADNLHMFVVFCFLELLILVFVHTFMEPMRRKLRTRVWHWV